MERLCLSDAANYSPAELSIHAARYLPLVPLVAGKRVLDLACGEGLGAWLLRQQGGAVEVVGVDVSVTAIASARATFGTDGLVFQAADAIDFLTRVDLGRFDAVACVETIEHLPDPGRFVSLLRRAVRDAGLIYVTCPNDLWYFGRGRSLNRYHLDTYDADRFFAVTVPHLGEPEHRFLGSVLSGFATYPVPVAASSTYRSAIDAIDMAVDALRLPSSDHAAEHALTDGACFYYAGLWNYTGTPTGARPALAAWPCAAEYRQPPIAVLPRTLQQYGAAARMTVAHDRSEAGRVAAWAVRDALGERLEVRLVEVDQARPATLAGLHAGEPAHFLHYCGAGVALAALRELPRIASSGDGAEARAWSIARPVTTCGALGDEPDQPAFWDHAAYLLDGYAVPSDHPRSRRPLPHKPLPEVFGRDDEDPVRTWLRLLRRAEVAAEGGVRSARYAEVMRRLRPVDSA